MHPQEVRLATLTIKNVPDDLYDELKRTAEAHRRSINSEVLVCLERALQGPRIDVDEFLAGVRKLRRKTKHVPLTDSLLIRARNEGRP